MSLPPPWDREPTVVDKAVSVALWTVGILWVVPLMSAMMLSNLVVRPDRTQWLSRLYCRGQVALTGARWKAVVDPAVKDDRVYLFACNHVNVLDHVTMYNATPHFKQGMELASHFKVPVYGWFMRQRGTIAVRARKDGGQSDELREQIRAELAQGHSILAFPEGTRTRTGRVAPFRKGLFYIARELGLPIVPVTVTGMYEIIRAESLLMRPGKQITVYCDAPIEPTDEPEVLAERVRAVIAARVDAHMDGRSS